PSPSSPGERNFIQESAKRRGNIDAQDQNHQNQGGGRQDGPRRLRSPFTGPHSLSHTQNDVGHGNEDQRQKAEIQDGNHPVILIDGGLQNRELAQKQSKGRRTGDGQESGEPENPGPGQNPAHPADVVDLFGLIGPENIPGYQEQAGFGQGVIDGMKAGTEHA